MLSSNGATRLASFRPSRRAILLALRLPVVNLDFELELLYQHTTQSTLGLYGKPIGTIDGKKAPFPSVSDGFASRFEITRAF